MSLVQVPDSQQSSCLGSSDGQGSRSDEGSGSLTSIIREVDLAEVSAVAHSGKNVCPQLCNVLAQN